MNNTVSIRAWGLFALFCPAELRADPYSEDVITPSAAKGLLRAIYWKPEFEYEIARIVVFHPIQRTAADGYALKRANTTEGASPQAKSVLVDVSYGIEARIVVNPHRSRRSAESYRIEAERRMRKGEMFRPPCFGRVEYPASYEWSDPETWHGIRESRDLGPMLLDQVMVDPGRPGDRGGFSATFEPVYWPLEMVHGAIHIPEVAYGSIRERHFQMRARVHPHKPEREGDHG